MSRIFDRFIRPPGSGLSLVSLRLLSTIFVSISQNVKFGNRIPNKLRRFLFWKIIVIPNQHDAEKRFYGQRPVQHGHRDFFSHKILFFLSTNECTSAITSPISYTNIHLYIYIFFRNFKLRWTITKKCNV